MLQWLLLSFVAVDNVVVFDDDAADDDILEILQNKLLSVVANIDNPAAACCYSC